MCGLRESYCAIVVLVAVVNTTRPPTPTQKYQSNSVQKLHLPLRSNATHVGAASTLISGLLFLFCRSAIQRWGKSRSKICWIIWTPTFLTQFVILKSRFTYQWRVSIRFKVRDSFALETCGQNSLVAEFSSAAAVNGLQSGLSESPCCNYHCHCGAVGLNPPPFR